MVPVLCVILYCIIRLFPNYRNGFCMMCYIILYHKAVPELQEWFIHHVRYHIDHKAVPELQEWFLHDVLYHKAVPELHEWFLTFTSLSLVLL